MSGEKGMVSNKTFANMEGMNASSGDSEDVFEEEELSSSECDSADGSGYSQNDGAEMFSQESSMREKKLD